MITRFLATGLASGLVLLGFASSVLAAEVELDDFDGPSKKEDVLDGLKSTVAAACQQAAYYRDNAAALNECNGTNIDDFKAESLVLQEQAGAYLWLTDRSGVGACKPTALPVPADAEVAKAQKELEDARADLTRVQADAAADADQRKAAEERVRDGEAKVKAAEEKNLKSFKTSQLAGASARVNEAVSSFSRAVSSGQGKRDVDDFESIAEMAINASSDDTAKTRADKCIELYKKRLDAFDTKAAATIDAATTKAHEADTLRKTSAGSTIATLASSAVEQPGSPDYIVYSIMSALGADEETSGNQLAVVLNLSSLIWPDPEKRLSQPVEQRNLFLRGTFPLDDTNEEPSVPAGDEPTSDGSTRRFSLVLGGSFLDETDTRLDANRRCYEAALAYTPFAPSETFNDERTTERQAYFDVCNHLVVNRSRLAWRAGVGFLSDQGDSTTSTKPEMYAGLLVWSPSSQLYMNLIYQRFVRPRDVHVGGIGLSVAGNAGGGRSGTTAWARVGLDTTFLLGHDPSADVTSWELRIAPMLRGRVFGDSVTSLAIGPRIAQDGPASLLATVTFGYDADRMMTQLLAPLPKDP